MRRRRRKSGKCVVDLLTVWSEWWVLSLKKEASKI
jgi:hypothetical protein